MKAREFSEKYYEIVSKRPTINFENRAHHTMQENASKPIVNVSSASVTDDGNVLLAIEFNTIKQGGERRELTIIDRDNALALAKFLINVFE